MTAHHQRPIQLPPMIQRKLLHQLPTQTTQKQKPPRKKYSQMLLSLKVRICIYVCCFHVSFLITPQYSIVPQDRVRPYKLPHAETFWTEWVTYSSMYSMSKVHKQMNTENDEHMHL